MLIAVVLVANRVLQHLFVSQQYTLLVALIQIPIKDGDIEPMMREVKIMQSVSQAKNIVQYLGANHEGYYFNIFMEFMSGKMVNALIQQELIY